MMQTMTAQTIRRLSLLRLVLLGLTISIIGSLIGVVPVAQASPSSFTVQLKGESDVMEGREVVPLLKDLPASVSELLHNSSCYPLSIFDPATNLRIGQGFDCLTDLDTESSAPAITVTEIPIFIFGDDVLIASTPLTAQPFVVSAGDKTHLTGSFPLEPNIIFGQGRFAQATGIVRVSGGVNLTQSPQVVDFNCLFVVNLDN